MQAGTVVGSRTSRSELREVVDYEPPEHGDEFQQMAKSSKGCPHEVRARHHALVGL